MKNLVSTSSISAISTLITNVSFSALTTETFHGSKQYGFEAEIQFQGNNVLNLRYQYVCGQWELMVSSCNNNYHRTTPQRSTFESRDLLRSTLLDEVRRFSKIVEESIPAQKAEIKDSDNEIIANEIKIAPSYEVVDLSKEDTKENDNLNAVLEGAICCDGICKYILFDNHLILVGLEGQRCDLSVRGDKMLFTDVKDNVFFAPLSDVNFIIDQIENMLFDVESMNLNPFMVKKSDNTVCSTVLEPPYYTTKEFKNQIAAQYVESIINEDETETIVYLENNETEEVENMDLNDLERCFMDLGGREGAIKDYNLEIDSKENKKVIVSPFNLPTSELEAIYIKNHQNPQSNIMYFANLQDFVNAFNDKNSTLSNERFENLSLHIF